MRKSNLENNIAISCALTQDFDKSNRSRYSKIALGEVCMA